MRPKTALALSEADQELAEWISLATETAERVGLDRAIEFWSGAMIDAGVEDPLEIVPPEFHAPLMMTGLAIWVRTLVELDQDRTETGAEA